MTEPAKRRSTCDTMDESMDEELGIINVDIAALPLTSTLFDLANANLIRGEIAQHLDLQSLGRFGATCKLYHEDVSAEIERRKKCTKLKLSEPTLSTVTCIRTVTSW